MSLANSRPTAYAIQGTTEQLTYGGHAAKLWLSHPPGGPVQPHGGVRHTFLGGGQIVQWGRDTSRGSLLLPASGQKDSDEAVSRRETDALPQEVREPEAIQAPLIHH